YLRLVSLLSCHGPHRDPHSFPTRRSSDLSSATTRRARRRSLIPSRRSGSSVRHARRYLRGRAGGAALGGTRRKYVPVGLSAPSMAQTVPPRAAPPAPCRSRVCCAIRDFREKA